MARDSGSGSLGTLVAGAVIGAAGLAWWLLAEAERRQQGSRQGRNGRLSRLSFHEEDALDLQADGHRPGRDIELQDKVQQLNQAIEDVRRQLEGLTPQG
ncbi:MAG: hypothetical protein RLZZ533_220 [Cyanobacteriota bacterium]|jgi:hypothetical protein